MSDQASWLPHAVIYNILIDRFARGGGGGWSNPDWQQPVFCGGNLEGIIEKLDYLQDLGITAILLTPFHPTSAYHGYHITDFFGVDRRFGSLETIKELLRQAHAHGIRVIMDFVPNHVSSQHPYFVDAQNDPDSPYRNWFTFTKWPLQYLTFLNFHELPKLNLENPQVQEHMLNAALYWAGVGFDGIRLDHIIGIPHQFLRKLHDAIKKQHPEVVLMGEAVKGKIQRRELKTLHLRRKYLIFILSRIGVNVTLLMQLQYIDVLDGVFDFFFRDMVKSFLIKPAWYKPRWLLRIILQEHFWSYPKKLSLISLLDNPDHDRFSFLLRRKMDTLMEAVRLQFAQPGPAMILYGSEAGLEQTESRKYKVYGDKKNGDLAIRRIFPWDHIDSVMLNYYKSLIRRKRQ